MAVFQVYSDESGKLADSQCVAFASILFRQEEALPFSNRWNELLAAAGVSYISMKEAMGLKGEFRGWKDRKKDRDDLLEALAALAWDRCYFLARSPMVTEEFRKLPQSSQEQLKDLPYAAFEALVKGIAEVSANSQQRDRFHLIYDLSEEYSVECIRLFNRLRMMRSQYRDLFSSLSFADDTEFPPLQAADMLAYVTRAGHTESASTTGPVVRRLAEILCKGKPLAQRDLAYKENDRLGHGVLELPLQ